MCSAHIVGIITSDNKERTLCPNAKDTDKFVPAKFLHSDTPLGCSSYKFVDCLQLHEVRDLQLVTIDAFAYRQKHQTRGIIVRLRTGEYDRGAYKPGKPFFRSLAQIEKDCTPLKLAGAISPEGRLYLIVEPANYKVRDIQPWAPIRVSGLYFLNAKVKRASAA
jgi:hypothetical protein